MQTTIELPDTVYRNGESIARAMGVTLEQLIVRALEREFTNSAPAQQSNTRISLPLIRSEKPGTLNLSNFDFNDLLA